MGEVNFFVQSLLEKARSPSGGRVAWVEGLCRQVPQLNVLEAVNGFDHAQTIAEMRSLGLAYHGLGFKSFGVLACWLTKFRGFKMQAEKGIPVACWIEDDLELGYAFEDGVFFTDFVSREAAKIDPKHGFLKMGDWGECYVTTLAGAQRLTAKLLHEGIRANIDDQLRGLGPHTRAPYRLRCWTNCGDTLKTGAIKEEELKV